MPANTTHGLPYPLPTEPVAEGAQAIRNLAEAVDTRVLGYGTTLPASPVDGQEYVLVDSTSAPTFAWRFRYNAGAAAAQKWEFVGGLPRVASYTADAALTAGVWTGVGGVAIPRTGLYLISIAGVIYCPTINAAVGLAYSADGSLTPTHVLAQAGLPIATNTSLGAVFPWPTPLLNAGATAALLATCNLAGGIARLRSIAVTPIRVA